MVELAWPYNCRNMMLLYVYFGNTSSVNGGVVVMKKIGCVEEMSVSDSPNLVS